MRNEEVYQMIIREHLNQNGGRREEVNSAILYHGIIEPQSEFSIFTTAQLLPTNKNIMSILLVKPNIPMSR